MENIWKKALYSSIWILTLVQTNISSAIEFDRGNVKWDIKGSEESADQVWQTIIANIMAFLYLISVVYWLWGGFNILTAGWDEEKVKKWKTVLIQAMIWLIVIFLAGSIIEWIINIILQPAADWGGWGA